MRKFALFAALLLGAGLASAPEIQADEAPEFNLGPGSMTYKWPAGQELDYRVQLYLATPLGTRFLARENLDARGTEITMAMLVKCVPQAPTAKSQSINCLIHRVELYGVTKTREDDKLRAIFNEYQETLTGATVQLEMSPQGRVKSLDLEGVVKGTSREATVQEYLRLVIRTGFSAFEIEMPKDGDPRGESWRQKGSPMVMRLPTPMGTAGGVRLIHEVSGREGDLVTITTYGEAVLEEGGLDGGDGGGNMSRTVSAVLVGESKMDINRGVLVSSAQTLQGVLTAGAGNVGSDLYINQVVMIDLLPNFDELDREYEEAQKPKTNAPKGTQGTLIYEADPGVKTSGIEQVIQGIDQGAEPTPQ